MALLDKSKLSEEELKEVSGGYIFEINGGYEVIDDKTGDVIVGNLTYGQAVRYCLNSDIGTREINWGQLSRLRETGSIDG